MENLVRLFRPKARPVVGRVRVTGFPSLAKAMEQRYFTHLGLHMGPTFRPVRSSVVGLIFFSRAPLQPVRNIFSQRGSLGFSPISTQSSPRMVSPIPASRSSANGRLLHHALLQSPSHPCPFRGRRGSPPPLRSRRGKVCGRSVAVFSACRRREEEARHSVARRAALNLLRRCAVHHAHPPPCPLPPLPRRAQHLWPTPGCQDLPRGAAGAQHRH